MIEGLKVCIPAQDLRALCQTAADHHAERAATYAQQIDSLKTAAVEGLHLTGGDPVEALTERRDDHVKDEVELRFLAKYIKEGEEYLLNREELASLKLLGGTSHSFRRRW